MTLNDLCDKKQTFKVTEALYQLLHRVPKKLSPLMFDNNFGKCGPIFKFFVLTCNMLLHYLVKVENQKKMLSNFHVERDN